MATPFSLENYNRFKATINPTWPHPPEYNPTEAQVAAREAQIRQEFKAIDAKHAAALEAERRAKAAETERLRREGGYFPGGNGYVTPRPGAWTPAMQAEVDNFSYNNPRPSPMTPNMAPLAPKQPSARERDGMPKGRGLTYEEAYGPGSTAVAERIAEERRIAKQRAMMQAGVNKVNKATPKSRGAPGPYQGQQFLAAFHAAQMGQYATPAAPAAPGAAQPPSAAGVPVQPQAPAPPPPAPSQRPPQPQEVAIAGGLTGNYRQAPIAAPPSYVPSNTQAHSGGIVERMQEPLPRPPVTQYPGTYQDAVNGLRQSVGYIPAPVQDPPSVITQQPTAVLPPERMIQPPQPQGQYGPAPPSEISSYAQTTSGGSPAFVDSSGKQYPIVEQKIGKSDRTSPTIVKDGKTYVMEQDGNGRWVTAWEIKKSK